jgi:hypothetical protein
MVSLLRYGKFVWLAIPVAFLTNAINGLEGLAPS